MSDDERTYVVERINYFKNGPYSIERMPHRLEQLLTAMALEDSPDVSETLVWMNDLFLKLK